MHKYSFRTVWQLPASPRRCWHELVVLRSWQQWWPAFQPTAPLNRRAPAVGEDIGLTVRSPLGYKLRIRVKITELMPSERLGMTGSGDLDGIGLAVFEAAGNPAQPGTVVTIDWIVDATKPWMKALAPIAAPALRWAHGKVMADGERRFRTYLTGPV